MARNSARGASRAASRRQVPGWVWLFTGVVSGLFVAFLFHLATIPPANRPAGEQSAPAVTEQSGEPEDSGPSFDFYAVLPQMEVILPQSKPESGEAADTDTPSREEVPTRTPGDRGEGPSEGESYMLQAGSFRSEADADRRRAELIMEGFDVKVQSVELEAGHYWHRVMIGPFTDPDTMHDAQDALAESGIEVLPIRARKPEG